MPLASLLLPFLIVVAQGDKAAPQAPPDKFKTYQFVMLKKGAPVAMTADEHEGTLKAHLANLEKLWLKDGKAVLVGPFTDNGDIAGIVVLDTSAEEAKSLMAEDPFVKKGAMVPDIRPLMA